MYIAAAIASTISGTTIRRTARRSLRRLRRGAASFGSSTTLVSRSPWASALVSAAAIFDPPLAAFIAQRSREVFLHSAEEPYRLAMFLFAEVRHELGSRGGAEILQCFEHRMGGRQQVQAPSAPVSRVRPTLQHSRRFEPIDDSTDGDRFDLKQLGERALADALVSVQKGENLPLGPRHSAAAAILLEALLQHPRNIDEQK